MTISQLKEFSNEELRVRVAKVVGWQPVGESHVLWKSPLQARGVTEGPWFPFSAVPNYPEDLNAMAAAERPLSDVDFELYEGFLGDLSGSGPYSFKRIRFKISAKARDRAIAFLAVRGREG